MKYISVLALFFFSISAHAEPRACTEMGCTSGFTIQVSPDYRWQPGQYHFAFQLDDKTITCDGVLPLPPCEQNGMKCSAEGVIITQSGCALPKEDHGFGDMFLSIFPKQVGVNITRDSKTIAAQQFTPAYQVLQPNGEGCEPVCKQATTTLDIK